jgi:Pyruvate/2-oxoacid:ferredoxin oxidoreductase gamma subunit
MATARSVDLLPQIFQTETNKQFLAATLDQLTQEPKFKKTQGYIGRAIGPGVNPNDTYVVEPDAVRRDYQLEPGVVSLVPDTDTIKNAITYPGINDAVSFSGGDGSRPDRLYQSEYYSWDPFVDFDTFVNFSQYFWLPAGPDAVDVAAATIPTSDNFNVTRENGVYTFSGVTGQDPVIDLVRGGNYTFQIAQNNKETVNYRVSNSGISAYLLDGLRNPTLTLTRGNTYVFNLVFNGDFPFWIKTAPVTGLEDVYNTGVIRNGARTGLVTFTVPQDAPNILYYASQTQLNMQGTLNIVDGIAGTGPGFWIQAFPGVNGKDPVQPNISSRDVLGVVDNGTDLGTVTFNVPQKTAQNFYYSLTPFGVNTSGTLVTPVDIICDLKFDQINNQSVDEFLATYGGIDGTANLNGRTLVFTEPVTDAEAGGWQITSFFDPLPQSSSYNAMTGSFDTTFFSQTGDVLPEDRYQLWQIKYVTIDNFTYISLSKLSNIPVLNKFKARYGVTYSNTEWYKKADGTFERIPLLTAAMDTLYYQDGTDPEIFGRIRLVEQTANTTLFIDAILDKKSYTSPNGVVFTNGLKVKFIGDVVPATYASGSFNLIITAAQPGSNYLTTESTANLYIGEKIVFVDSIGGVLPGTYYIQSLAANGIQFSISTQKGGGAYPLELGSAAARAIAVSNLEYYVSGVGTAIELLPVDNFSTPELYVVDANDSTIYVEPNSTDYLTINRASQDRNAWSRSNRWFHSDVINATAKYNNTTATFDNNYRAKRPIIQFRADIRLWNMGTEGKDPVDIIDFSQTDAFSNVEGSTGYSIDGYTLIDGSRVIFAADEDQNVKDKIYVVSFIVPDTVAPLIAQPIISLSLASDGEVLTDQCTVCLYGTTVAGATFWFDGAAWTQAQQKTSVQQAPLFNVYNPAGYSFGDQTIYQSSTFAGSKLFSYAVDDTSIIDPILQFPLQYLNINNVGDIVFVNNLYKDTFLYVVDNASVTLDISSGSVKEYTTRAGYQRLIGWQTAATPSQDYQQFKFTYTGATLKLDVKVNAPVNSTPAIKIYVGSVFQAPSTYSYLTTSSSTTITLNNTYIPGDTIEVLALSDQTSSAAFYQVPINLQNNPLNGNSPEFTLGTIRTHYESICQNLLTVTGPVNGSNNTRDLGNLVPYGLTILQQSSPMTLAGYFLRSPDYNIFASLSFANREYNKYKYQLLDAVTQQTIGFDTIGQVLDTAIQDITLGRVETQPFYWSDMLPSGAVYITTTYTIGYTSTSIFDTVQVYNYRSANYLGMNVYLGEVLLVRDRDYVVAADGPRITVLIDLPVGSKLTLQEYSATYGSFAPNTPTKLGLYPAFVPQVITQRASGGNVQVTQGHDGSITPLFNDIRDQVLLEFETRIYNNLKLDGNPVPLTIDDVLPGQFRNTGFSYSEITEILNQDFLSYVGANKLDYRTQDFRATNEFTWNYSSTKNKLNNSENLLGAWRGINRYFYDTEQPQYTPWEMLGLSKKPLWWEGVYGPAPYTGDNLVLWDDLAAGYVADPIAPYFRPEYARPASIGSTDEPPRGGIWGDGPYPSLAPIIPTGDEGQLLSPFNSTMGTYANAQFQKSWAPGDGGPVEASFWNSSSYPFAVMHVLAVTRPAKFFALFADRDLYRYNVEFDQYLLNDRYRLDANGVEVYGNGVSKASYIDWIVDYNRQSGIDSTDELTADLANLDVRLCYRMASFSDKQYIKLYTEKSSPNSTNTTLLIPDESYNLLLYKNQPFDRTSYSAVVIQNVPGGYAVFGYSTSQPYFKVLASRSTGQLRTIASGGATVRVPTFYTNTVNEVPYGFIFANETSVCDFLLSYGKLSEQQGITFTNRANGYVLDWNQMCQEFLYWSQQGWGESALLNLNPLAAKLTVTREQAVVDSIVVQAIDNVLLDQNNRELPTRNLNITRIDNTFTCEPLTTQTLSFIDLKYTTYEHMIVLDNQSVFGDLIYQPITGARQSRLILIASNTSDWTGQIDTPGFILNQDNVEEWTGFKRYTKGQLVKYKNVYWSALKIIQPSEKFNFSEWVQSDYTQIELGLLPNLANKANQLSNSYNINSANLESDNDLLSYGLIGFRPRQYMAALNLDDVSQLNIYRQFLGSKGTILSAELFSNANLGKEAADYSIYENWAVLRSTYGANANRSFVELRLDRANLSSNPSLVQVVLPQQVSSADQQILFSDVWKQSYKLTSPNFLPTTTTTPTDIALPTAGYVNLNDADITVFDINDLANIAANLDAIAVGTSIWVAKINDYDWNVYRAQAVPGSIQHVCDNLDGTSRVIFSQSHGLSAGNTLIIKFFDTEVNGVYQVLSVANLTTVNIAFQFANKRTVANGLGLGFTLQTMRVAQASDVIDLPYANDILAGAKVWVDNNGDNLWQVIQKQQVFVDSSQISPLLLDAGEQFGSAIAQATARLALFVGSPQYGFGSSTQKGAVYVYVKNSGDQYAPVSPIADADGILTLDQTGVRGYGNAIDFGNQTWAVAGASKSLGPGSEINNGYASVIYRDPALGQPGINPFTNWQLLTLPGTTTSTTPGAGEFGYSVTMSLDERWMYVGAPGLNTVYAYGRVPWEDQVVTVLGNGVTTQYTIGSAIQINNSGQLKILIDGQVQTTGYSIDAAFDKVTFTTAPDLDALIKFQRINTQQLDAQTYYDVPQTSTSGSGSGAKFTIIRVRGQVGQPGATSGGVGATSVGTGYAVGNTITIAGASFGGTNNIVLTITSVGTGGTLGDFNIAYTAPTLATVFSLNEYFFTATNIYSFSIDVGGVLYRPNIDYTFSTATQDLTFTGTGPAAGSVIIARAQSYFTYVNSITASGLSAGDRFGHSIACTTDGRQLIVGTPYSTQSSDVEAGSVYVIDRNVQKFIYGNDGSTVTFTLLGTPVAPVSVIVNNVFLTNQTDSIVGAPNTFYWNGANTVTINADLQYGDVIEIETNQFAQIQKLTQNTVANFSNFGQSVDICAYNCSLYAGVPQSSMQIYKGGVVERDVNQSRVYGTITSTVANAALTAGNTVRVNNMDVVVPAAWSSLSSYYKNDVVYNLSGSTYTIYVALQDVPAATLLTNTSYWRMVSTTIVAASIYVRALAAQINSTVPNVNATVDVSGYLTVSVKNNNAAPAFNKLQVAPGSVGSAFTTLGFNTFAFTQTILSPYPVKYAAFGSSINISDSATTLVVGAPNGTLYLITVFDDGNTDFDADSTTFITTVNNSGAVYTYDYLPGANMSVSNPGKFLFGQQINNSEINALDTFGSTVSYIDGILVAGAPNNDVGDSTANYGRVFLFENPTRGAAWTVIQEQQPVVDISLINGVFTYDRITSATTQFFDFFDPLQGKILGAARQNIDYIGSIDPANYNIGPSGINGATWWAGHVGEVWWDTNAVRFIDPNQDDITYASRRWGQIFPGSSVDVYQWILSTVPPTSYTGPGVPYSTSSYSINSRLNRDGIFATEYYFWVRGITTTAVQQGKTLSVATVAQYIENPRASGITYMAPINASTIALYNAAEYVVASDTVINISFDRQATENNVHTEYELIAEGKPDAFLSTNLYRKLQDSFCGVDTFGNNVPDPNLSPAERYGVQFRPRQSMFVDRFDALKNYLTRVNAVLARFTISESRSFNLLNSAEPEPSAATGLWNLRVANLEILGFQNIYTVPLGYRYLVVTDSNNRGLWTIYTVTVSDQTAGERQLRLSFVQGYNTADYWNYIDWYRPGYNSSTKALAEVPNKAGLNPLGLPVGSSVRVTANSQGKWEIYLLTDMGWERVGLQDGTIAFSAELWNYQLGRFGFDIEVFDAQYYDQEPVKETRKIIQAVNEELLIDDLAVERNLALTLMFNYVLSEFSAPEWLIKTSLIDVDHRIRDLVPYQNYRRDNQEFVLDYIKEVKPYHVQLREFNLRYNGLDQYPGSLTDFDIPAYYNTSLAIPQYTSPILLPYEHGTSDVANFLSDQPSNSILWSAFPYNQWYNNYLLTLTAITVVDNGTGYTEPPLVIIGDAWTSNTAVNINQQLFYINNNVTNLYTVVSTGTTGIVPPTFTTSGTQTNGTATLAYAGLAATATSVINSLGQIVAINVIDSSAVYRSTPNVTFDGGGGTGRDARAYAVVTPGLARSFKTTIKYDRFQYFSDVQDWNSSGTYQDGQLVRYDDRVWQAASLDSTAVVGPDFNLEDWTLIPARDLTGVDRTMGLYVPGVNQPGLELPLLIDGVDYPGVQVYGNYFLGTDADDATYASSFTDTTLGNTFSSINVNGGEFVGLYEGHAPEELVNGAEFDTLDMRVYTRPGADWNRDGHGFQMADKRYLYEAAVTNTFSWAGLVDTPVQVSVVNTTTNLPLSLNIDYTVDWVSQTITTSTVSNGDIISITAYELGGGSQLYRSNFTGTGSQTQIIPVNAAEIISLAIFVNGTVTSGATWTPYVASTDWNQLSSYSQLDVVNTNDGSSAETYYRAIKDVPAGIDITNVAYWLEFVPTVESIVNFGVAYSATDEIALTAFGASTIDAGYFVIGRQYTITQVGTTNFVAIGAGANTIGTVFTASGVGTGTGQASTSYSWSTPQTQYIVADANFVTFKTATLTNSVQGSNRANMIVTRNGLRLQPPEGREWISDGSSLAFGLPTRGGYNQSIINATTDVFVWVDEILQQQSIGGVPGTYSVTPYVAANDRDVVFNVAPPAGARILISVTTQAGYDLAGNNLQIVGGVNLNDLFTVTTFNDTSQLNPLTLVFNGPIVTGVEEIDPFDPLPNEAAYNGAPGSFDYATVNDTQWSFAYSKGVAVYDNQFWLERANVSPARLWVTLDGYALTNSIDYTVEGEYLILASGAINPNQIMVITEITNSIVPDAMAFRIFQDMRGVQATYRITPATTTTLVQTLSATDNVMYVENVLALGHPNLDAGVFGVCTVNGERIMYRDISIANNTVTGLMRGTAGTAAADHSVNTAVYDLSRGNLLQSSYQDYIVSDTSTGDGSTTVFYAPSINVNDFVDSSSEAPAIEVYVGGTRQYAYSDTTATSQYRWFVTDFDPLAVDFVVDDTEYPPLFAPAPNVEVTILVRQGVTWYERGITTPSDGIALQDTDTVAARFLRGL